MSNACLYLFGTGSRGSSTATQNDTQVPFERLVLPYPIREAPGTTLAAKAGYNINFPWFLSITPDKRWDEHLVMKAGDAVMSEHQKHTSPTLARYPQSYFRFLSSGQRKVPGSSLVSAVGLPCLTIVAFSLHRCRNNP